MSRNKLKFALRISPETKNLVEQRYENDNCESQSEFIEKAVRFYCGYLSTKDASAYLPEVLSTMLCGILDSFGDRMGSLLHKVAVEQNICNHIIALDTDMDAQEYQQMRGKSIREVKSTNGRISLKDALRSERSV